MASIMDFFKSGKADQSNTQGTNGDASPNVPGDNKQVPDKKLSDSPDISGPNPNDLKRTPENSLDAYSILFDNATKKGESKDEVPSFSLDPKVLSEVSARLDFSKDIDPELMTKATSGDVQSLIALMNEVGRRSYKAALEHGTRLTDTHLNLRSEHNNAQTQRLVKDAMTMREIESSIDFAHPLVKQEVNRIARQLAQTDQFADANPTAIATAAKEYFIELYSALNPDSKKKQTKDPSEIDYMDYLKGN